MSTCAGDALIQNVLDDHYLQIGDEGSAFFHSAQPQWLTRPEHGFQLAHATYSLEKIIKSLIDSSAKFEIVLWQCAPRTHCAVNGLIFPANRHGTVATGSSSFVCASRCLARQLLILHVIQNLSSHVKVHVFSSPEDPLWEQYWNANKVCSWVCDISAAYTCSQCSCSQATAREGQVKILPYLSCRDISSFF